MERLRLEGNMPNIEWSATRAGEPEDALVSVENGSVSAASEGGGGRDGGPDAEVRFQRMDTDTDADPEKFPAQISEDEK